MINNFGLRERLDKSPLKIHLTDNTVVTINYTEEYIYLGYGVKANTTLNCADHLNIRNIVREKES